MAAASGGLAAIATLGTGGVAHAAQTFTVSNLNDSGPGSLRAAIDQVNADATDTSPGDSIVFASGVTGTINLTSTANPADSLYVNNPVQIIGPGANALTIHAAPNTRVLHINGGGSLSGLTITGGNAGSGEGGGIYDEHGKLYLHGVDVTGNTAAVGGGVAAYSSASGYVYNSTFSGNTATVKGGGLYEYDFLTAQNSTFSGNTAPSGAGLYVYDPIYLTSSTVVGNTISSGGLGGQVGMKDNSGTYLLQLRDTIVAGSGSLADIQLPSNATQDVKFSLIRNTSASGPGEQSIATDATDVSGLDPQLGQLGFNGGPVPTMVPLPTSPVLDRGNSFGLTTDERGLPRPFVLPTISFVPPGGNHADIGAVESETPAVGAISPASGSTGTSVAIVGTGFTGATQVLFGSTPAGSFTVLNDGTIVATAPAQNGGSADVRVITPLGASPFVAGDKFTFATFTATVTKPHAKLSGRTVKTGIKVSCPAGGFSCSGSWKATAFVKHHKTKVASGSISLGAGHSKTITFKLGKKAYNQLKSKGSLKITVHIVVKDDSGGPVTVNRTITLHLKKHKKH